MAEPDWKWWAGSSEESYHTSTDTREQAIDALEGEGGWICEAYQSAPSLSGYIPWEYLLEGAEDNADDLKGEDGEAIFEMTEEQEDALIKHLKRACDEFQAANGLVFKSWTFTGQRNGEFIDATE